MANAIEYMDSFEIPDQDVGGSPNLSARYSISTISTVYQTSGRGTTHRGCAQSNGGGGYVGRTVAAEATKWCAVAFQPSNAGVASGIMQFVETGGTVKHISIMMNASGKVEVRRGTNTGTLLGTSANAVFVSGAYEHVEAQVTIHSSAGVVKVWVNEILVVNLTGQNTSSGGSALVNEVWLGGESGQFVTLFDDWIIQSASATTGVGDCRVGYLAPTANGTYTSGTPVGQSSLWLNASKSGPASDNWPFGGSSYDEIDSTSLPKKLSFQVEALPSNVVSILAAQVVANIKKDDAGSCTARVGIKSGATEVDNGADIAAQTIYQTLPLVILTTDPNTGAAWTAANLHNAEPVVTRVA